MSIATGAVGDAIDAKVLRRAMGAYATGVTVVTVGGAALHAMTANSFTSVSLNPPLVLVCIDHKAVMHRALSGADHFGVSVLTAGQQEVARHFADNSRTLGAVQFENVACRPGRYTGAPLIDGALATFECELWDAHDAGDHTIFLGRVLSLQTQDREDGLLYFRGGFRRIERAS